MLLALVRGISSADEIGITVEPYISLLAIVFCADALECEYREKRGEIFSILPAKNRRKTIRQRLLIQWGYLWILSMAGYWLFYWQGPNVRDVSHLALYGMFVPAVGVSILFWGTLSAAVVNRTRKLLPGIAVMALLWLCLYSKEGSEILGNLSVFAFSFRDVMAVEDYGWVLGKIAAGGIALLLLAGPSVVRRKG